MNTYFSKSRVALTAAAILLAMSAAAQTAPDMATGEVRKVDQAAAKITLKHGEIKSLDMPPMTMVFTVKDKALLDKVQVGDKIRFTAISEGGKILVTDIQAAKP